MLSSQSAIMHSDLDRTVSNPWVESSVVSYENTHNTTENSPPEQYVSNRTYHARSHTTTGHPLRSPSPPVPIEHGDFTRRASFDLHETLPSLRRTIKYGTPDAESAPSSSEQTTNGKLETQSDPNAGYIVHQIQPTDSLAGIALKYNTSVAALRTANKLWVTDSIHLRQTLYIPMGTIATLSSSNRISKVTQQRPDRPLPHSPPDSGIKTHSGEHGFSSGRNEAAKFNLSRPSVVQTIGANTGSAAKRTSLSEISFFSPASTSKLSSINRGGPHSLLPRSPPSIRPKPPRRHITLSGGPPAPASTFPYFSEAPGEYKNGTSTVGLTSFLSGAKEEIMSRLSLDSARGSSDTAEDPEVEMDIVRSKSTQDRQRDDNIRRFMASQDKGALLAGSAWETDSSRYLEVEANENNATLA